MMAEGQGPPPALWSAENPQLYYLVLTLRAKDGSIIECESCQVSLLRLACTTLVTLTDDYVIPKMDSVDK